ncbi:hypothetical protein EV360DRAFT_70198 [Lentinula raphanica]|nr:hypothetical protein EV360DRAFT_70198 [Lentinula raphanica]
MTASYTPLYDHTTTGSNTKFVVAKILYRLLLKIPIHAFGAQCRGVYSDLHLKPSGYREPSVNDPDFPFCNEPGTTTNVLTVTQTRTATVTLSKTIEPSVTPTSKAINTTKSFITSSGTSSTATQSSNTNGTQASHSSSSKSSRPGVIVGGVLGAVFGLMVVVLCIFYIRRRTRQPRPVRHDSTVESRTMSQPLSLPPPVPPKGIPVNITPDPFMLKYSEAHQDPREPLRSDISSSTEQPRGSSSQPDAHDNTSISELMGRLRTLEAQFAVDKLYRMRNPTPSPPNYMEEARK